VFFFNVSLVTGGSSFFSSRVWHSFFPLGVSHPHSMIWVQRATLLPPPPALEPNLFTGYPFPAKLKPVSQFADRGASPLPGPFLLFVLVYLVTRLVVPHLPRLFGASCPLSLLHFACLSHGLRGLTYTSFQKSYPQSFSPPLSDFLIFPSLTA